ncbi:MULTISPECIES: copper chaperone PCu(A)C [Streptomyces]|uniref:copper chaperone PCu(A)C n=1 Tax=Streptomyces TaxID=1883 RepID=UPI001B3994FE|nr:MULTISPECIES: copper chaperone PCu(A)C [unclassified Streptomyces]MBQ0877513.1 copper chaperone PCu(A)C [Streptomyces sp. RT42]MBU8553928.1 copper chaperone PCu(A)C [Streptomyces sp. Osf17]MBU8560726.1 copper chaperone PCu(A)C [Streptomyces sp. Babs14]UAX51618.1 copper chaperone PCu(A)C [Streptomyces sp. A144]
MKTPVTTDITTVENSVWVRWLPNALPAAGYITLRNSAQQRYTITKITSPDYQRITVYRLVTDSESSKYEKVDFKTLTIPAEGRLTMTPGGYHIMFEKPTHLITPGDNARVIFFLDDGKVFKVRMPVRTSPELN